MILQSNRLFVLSPISSWKFQSWLFSFIASFPIRTSSDPIPAFKRDLFGIRSNGITYESDPTWVWIADPDGFTSVGSRVLFLSIHVNLGS